MDAARMLPLLGAFLFLLPMLWRPQAAGHSTAFDGVFLFLVWAGLILLAALFAPRLAAGDAPTRGAIGSGMPGNEAGPPQEDLPRQPPGTGRDMS